MRHTLRILPIVIACLAPAAVVQAQPSAQTPSQDNPWSRGTMVSGFGGILTDSSRSGLLVGGSIGWDLTRRIAIDGSAAWTDYGDASDAFAAAIKVRTNLAWFGTAAPFLEAGVGMYRASFGPAAGNVPGFYHRRMTGGGAMRAERTFTDPSFVFGGGVNLGITRTVKLRPDLEVAVVRRGSRSHVVSGVRLHLVYVFEDRPVTPAKIR